jgi:hypothetical protein
VGALHGVDGHFVDGDLLLPSASVVIEPFGKHHDGAGGLISQLQAFRPRLEKLLSPHRKPLGAGARPDHPISGRTTDGRSGATVSSFFARRLWLMALPAQATPSNTGLRSPGEELMTFSTSAVAVCRSFASFSSRVRMPTCFCKSALDGAVIDALRALGLFERRPLTRCLLPPPRRISLPSSGSRRGSIICKCCVSRHGRKSGSGQRPLTA